MQDKKYELVISNAKLKCLNLRERVEVVERIKDRPPPFPAVLQQSIFVKENLENLKAILALMVNITLNKGVFQNCF